MTVRRSRSWYKLNLARGDRMCRTIPPGKPALMVSMIRGPIERAATGRVYTDVDDLIDDILLEPALTKKD